MPGYTRWGPIIYPLETITDIISNIDQIQHEDTRVGMRDLIKNYDIGLPFVNSFCVDESDPHPVVNLRINEQNNIIKEYIPWYLRVSF